MEGVLSRNCLREDPSSRPWGRSIRSAGAVSAVTGPTPMRFAAAGSGGAAPMVLVHGIGSSSWYFQRLSAVLARQGQVVAVDLPGFGRSPTPARPLSIAEHAEALGVFLAERGLGGAVLVGHSMGCQVITALLRGAPAAATRAVLIGPTVDPRARTALGQGMRLARNAVLEPKTLVPVQARSYLACGPRTYLGTVGAMLADRIEDNLPHVQVPVLLVRGEHDPIAPRRWVTALRNLASQVASAQVRGAHHVVQWSHPQAVADLCARRGTGPGTPE